MGNRFSSLSQYHTLILGHGVLAAITFLGLVPAAILIARFYIRSPGWALRLHIYFQILTVALTTVVFVLGWFAVGPERSLTNPHHGIGLAIYVLVLVQAIGGGWIHRREKGKMRNRIPVKLMLHQWLGRAIALLGFAQIPLGLTLYGSPLPLFIVYALWMAFLLLLLFILCYRSQIPLDGTRYSSYTEERITPERKHSRFASIAAPLAAGAGLAALSGLRRNRSRSRDRRGSVVEEVIPSRRGSYVEEKYDNRRKSSGVMDKVLGAAAILGAGALAKSFFGNRKRRTEEDDYSSVAPDTPSRRQRHRAPSIYSESDVEVHRMEEGIPTRPILPGPVARPVTPNNPMPAVYSAVDSRPGNGRRDSYDSLTYTSYMSSPTRTNAGRGHTMRNALGTGLLFGGLGQWFKNRREKKEQDRIDEIRAREIEEERIARRNSRRYTGDQFTPMRHDRREDLTGSSDLTSDYTDSRLEERRDGAIPAIALPLAAGGVAGAAISQSRSRHEITEPVSMPHAPTDPAGILHESDSDVYYSGAGQSQRRHSSRRRREAEAASAAAAMSARDESRRPRDDTVVSPPVSVKIQVHGDKDRNVTLRRLTEEEAAAERAVCKGHRRRRAESASSLSGTDTLNSRRRYRRDEQVRRDAEDKEKMAEAGLGSLPPPNPAFAKGRKPKDSAYYSGQQSMGPSTIGSPGSPGTWSTMSPGSGEVDAAERRRRRRFERNQKGVGSVDYN
jgi:hypothetical protein